MQNGAHLSESSYRSLWRIIDYRTVGKTENKNPLIERTLDFKVRPHQLRHTCITHWFESGLDIKEVQRLAGHENVEVTLRIYTHYQASQRAEETSNKIRSSAAAAML